MILNSFEPIPVASYQCSSATVVLPSESRTVASPFRFRHRPGSYARTRRSSSPIFLPTAIVSAPRIGPTILKSIGAICWAPECTESQTEGGRLLVAALSRPPHPSKQFTTRTHFNSDTNDGHRHLAMAARFPVAVGVRVRAAWNCGHLRLLPERPLLFYKRRASPAASSGPDG